MGGRIMKNKITLDPNANGSQWLYRKMGIQKQNHPKLLPYACYDWDRNEFLIGVCISKNGAKKLIDKYIANGCSAIGYEITHE